MKINRVSSEITAFTPEGKEKFGFSYKFSSGLNILTGDNSSGKSTVISCIYYCLGLEQLIGSKGTKALSPALHQSLNYDGKSYSIYESRCLLEITGNNGEDYTLERNIKTGDETRHSEIEITHNTTKFSRFIHSVRDHEDNGFYSWLAEINNLDIYIVDSTSGESTKPLYMQNVFTLSFIEQTKGWSDFFSMMPSFGIKDVRQKVIEYCLGLKSLKINMEIDRIKAEKSILKSQWSKYASNLDYKSSDLQIYISDFDRKKPISEEKINKLYLAKIDNTSNEIKIGSYISQIKNDIHLSEISVKSIGDNTPISQHLIDSNEKIKVSLARYNSEREEVSSLFEEEKQKLKESKKVLTDVTADIQDFQDVKKISIDRNWSKISTAQCPVCDSNIENKRDSGLSDNTISKSMAFLKSQKSTYESYITASESVIERYIPAINYYGKIIATKREQMNSYFEGIESPGFMSMKAEFEIQAELKQRIVEIESFNEYFSSTLEWMKSASTDYFRLDTEEKKLSNSASEDELRILTLRDSFKEILKSFGYRSNGVKNINIANKAPNRLLPMVNIDYQETQYIRFVSSASDFVRSIWSYYLALLINGTNHPGFLIMDEPGQHQMRVDSMKELLKKTSSIDKQVILAISQDRDYDSEKVNIHDLVKDISEESYNLMHIDDGNGCIIKLTGNNNDLE
jgi:hypothetical protein